MIASLYPAIAPSQQSSDAVDLELILAVDVSFSMDLEEQTIQRQGYVEAFRRPEVLAAISNGPLGRIAVTYVEWGGFAAQTVPWTLVDGPESAAAFADELSAKPLRRISFTSVTEALLFGRRLFRTNRFTGFREVIDVSGDGPNNSGAPVPLARDRLMAEGIVIDGLPIMLERPGELELFAIPDLDAYYKKCVVGGRGAFVLKVTDMAKFAETIRQKLILEITGDKLTGSQPHESGVTPARYVAPSSYNCLIGEELQESG